MGPGLDKRSRKQCPRELKNLAMIQRIHASNPDRGFLPATRREARALILETKFVVTKTAWAWKTLEKIGRSAIKRAARLFSMYRWGCCRGGG